MTPGTRQFLLVFGGVCLVGFLLKYLVEGWPVNGWLALVLASWLLIRNTESLLLRAAAKVLWPFIWALGAVLALQIIYNASTSSDFMRRYGEGPANGIWLAEVERALLKLDATLPQWTRLSVLEFALIAAALVALNLALPRIRLVGKFVLAVKWLGRTAAIVAALACFTFFAHRATDEPLQELHDLVRADIARQRERNLATAAEALARQSIANALRQMTATERARLNAVLSEFARPKTSPAAAQAIAGRLADTIFESVASSRPEIPEPPAGNPQGGVSRSDLTELDQEARALGDLERQRSEAEIALREVLGVVAGEFSGPALDVLKRVVDHVVELQSEFATEQLKAFGAKTASMYLDRLQKPLIDWLVRRAMAAFSAFASTPPSVTQVVSEGPEWAVRRAVAATDAAVELAKAALDSAPAVVRLRRAISLAEERFRAAEEVVTDASLLALGGTVLHAAGKEMLGGARRGLGQARSVLDEHERAEVARFLPRSGTTFTNRVVRRPRGR